MAVINGNDLVLKASETNGSEEPFAHAQSASLSISNSLIETTTKDSSSWMENISGKKSWSVSTDGLIDYSSISGSLNTDDFVDTALAGNLIYVQLEISDGAATPDIDAGIYSGEGYIDSIELSGSTDDVATYSVTITGNGALTNS